MNPIRSRSTIICIVCIGAFLFFAQMVLKAGYFDAGFGAAGIMFLSSVLKYSFDHQAKNFKKQIDEENPITKKP